MYHINNYSLGVFDYDNTDTYIYILQSDKIWSFSYNVIIDNNNCCLFCTLIYK